MLQVPELERNSRLPLETLQWVDQCLSSAIRGYLKIDARSVTWFIYVDQGKLRYITHSVDPIDRLDCHLRGLSHRLPAITTEVRTQTRLSLELPSESSAHFQPDYRGIEMLLGQGTLSAEDAQPLLRMMSQESLELLLLVKDHSAIVVACPEAVEAFQPLNFETLLHDCQTRLYEWQSLAPYVNSPYQRPYLFRESESRLSSDRQHRLGRLLKGYSFRHIATLVSQDELKLVKSLYPLILDRTIILKEPQPPYHELPTFSDALLKPDRIETASLGLEMLMKSESLRSSDPSAPLTSATQIYRIACIDDSPAMLDTIEQFLGRENITLFLIQDSVKALLELMQIKPDLILLEVDMPKVNGYDLCRLLRKHPRFNKIPIIMVTSRTGLIDRARANMSGTTDYMTKPFTQAELLKMVFRHLESVT